MKIAILGWGSLLWDPRDLKLVAPFELTGPSLPIEFCRVSKNLRLTLIIHEEFGTLCQTYAATSAFTNRAEAMENLRVREGMSSTGDVGFAIVANQERSHTATKLHPHATETIADWTANAGYDAAIWTALDSRFEEQATEPFSVNAAMRFLEKLAQHNPESFVGALDYIRRAPDATQTPVRDRTAAQWPDEARSPWGDRLPERGADRNA
jgi:hypothetical protein